MGAVIQLYDQYNKPMRGSSYQSGFEGAAYGRRLGVWGLSTSGPDSQLTNNLNSLRYRSRELVRNEPLIASGIDTLVANFIGTGITPRFNIDEPEIKEALRLLWCDWVKESDLDGVLNFYGQQSLACRSMIESGEVFVRMVPQSYGSMTVPLKLQILEADHCPHDYNTQVENGNEIRMGIEFNKQGQRVAYWMHPEHPGETYLSDTPGEKIRIPASEILHIYRPLRPGQKRGGPWVSSLITLIHDLNKYLDAEIVRKQATAMYGGFITAPPGGEESIPNLFGQSGPTPQDETGTSIIPLEPGTFPKLPAGYSVEFSEPADVGNSYYPFVQHQERRIGRGFANLPYEIFSGDLSNANYSSLRTGALQFQRFALQIIEQVITHQLCQPVGKYWLNTAVLSKAINIPDFNTDRAKYYRIEWVHSGFPLTDPLKDGKATRDDIAAGLKSRAEALAERGRDVEQVDSEIAEDKQRAESLGLRYEGDPQSTNGETQ